MSKPINLEYSIVKAPNIEILEGRVNSSLRFGWRCLGGLCIHSDTYLGAVYYQAMVRG